MVVTRSANSTSTGTGERAGTVSETTATAIVALDVAATGPTGIQLTVNPSAQTTGTPESSRLANLMAEALRTPGQEVQSPSTASSAILAASKAPGVRVVLGNSRVTADTSRFADPAWADTVARALYRALGAAFGRS